MYTGTFKVTVRYYNYGGATILCNCEYFGRFGIDKSVVVLP